LDPADIQRCPEDRGIDAFGKAKSLWNLAAAGLSFEISNSSLDLLPVDAL
jgi:hypothetical protein